MTINLTEATNQSEAIRPAAGPKPSWLRVRAPVSAEARQTRTLMRDLKLRTVCEEASCPNIGVCWKARQATFLILGGVCTRNCAFCNVPSGRPGPLDLDEPQQVAEAARALKLKHVVITSVDRDDLDDGGAAHYVATLRAVRETLPDATIEVLTPDFRGKTGAAELVIDETPDVFNHNLETVPRLYPDIRPGARYFTSLRLLQMARERNSRLYTKSGIMVGLGETEIEIRQVMDDLRAAGVQFMTIGQYLQPTPRHVAVARYVPPEEFDHYAVIARAKGFKLVSSTPLTRSSYHAGADFERLRAADQPG